MSSVKVQFLHDVNMLSAEDMGAVDRIYAAMSASNSKPGIISVVLSASDLFDQDVKFDLIQISDRVFANDPKTPILDKNGLHYSMAADVWTGGLSLARACSKESKPKETVTEVNFSGSSKGRDYAGDKLAKERKKSPVPYYRKFSGKY